MSCFKIIIIFTKILLIISITKAIAKEPNQVVVAKVNNHIITAQDVLNATNRLPKKVKSKPVYPVAPITAIFILFWIDIESYNIVFNNS